MEYLKLFSKHSDYAEYKNNENYIEPNVCTCINEEENHFNQYMPPYLTFIAEEPNVTIKINRTSTATTLPLPNLQYSLDDGETWSNYTFTQEGTVYSGETITLNSIDDSVKFKGNNTHISISSITCRFFITGMTSVKGDLTTLLNENGNVLTLSDYEFYELFSYYCSGITSAPKLPSATLGNSCYVKLFNGCKSLKKAPLLPATSIGQYAYSEMFYNCINLVSATTINALILPTYACNSMFEGCKSLIKAPCICATTIQNYGCYEMFKDCTALTEPMECLPATSLGAYCYRYMFSNCKSLQYGPNILATVCSSYGCEQMFDSCTSLVEIPDLKFTVLNEQCCDSMFKNCYSLTAAPALPATTMKRMCYGNMFQGCSSLTEAPVLKATSLINGCYTYMFKDCKNITYIKALFTSFTQSETWGWVDNVASAGTFVKHPNGNLPSGKNGIPCGWTITTATS